MELLGLSEDELCQVLDVDPLSCSPASSITAPSCRSCSTCSTRPPSAPGRRCCGAGSGRPGPAGRPIDALLARDFGAFEDALAELAARGFVLRGGG